MKCIAIIQMIYNDIKIYFVARFKGMGIDWNLSFLCQVSYEILFLSPLKFLRSTKLL